MEPLKQWPAAFDAQAQKINEIVEALRPLLALKSADGVKLTFSDNDITIGYNDGGSAGGTGGALPSGYGPEEWTVYDGGVVTTRNFLTDNPD